MSYRIRYSRDNRWTSVHPEPKWPEWFDYTAPWNHKWLAKHYPSGLPVDASYMAKEASLAEKMPMDELKRQLAHHEWVLETKMVQSVWDPDKEIPAHKNDLEFSRQMVMSLSARINAIDKSNTPQASS